MMRHKPVLVGEVVRFLAPAPGKLIVDATVGTGGHAEAILDNGAEVIGIDQDPEALAAAATFLASFGDRVRLRRGNFRRLDEIVKGEGIEEVDGVLFDLGMSSLQVESGERGFSFQRDGPLDMRMDPDTNFSAADLLARLSQDEIAHILWKYGEERYARRIASQIVRRRREAPIRTTLELADLVAKVYPKKGLRIHPATRTFQALRIAVNDELCALKEGLYAAKAILRPEGVLCVISYHSLEDRIVKQTFRKFSAQGQLELLTKKPVQPSLQEVKQNPRARSAKLRAARVPKCAQD